MVNGQSVKVAIRNACIDDIAGIGALVAECGPYLSRHLSYQYFVYANYFRQTCAVALEDGRVIGWRSTLRVSRRKYFMHQICVHPDARGKQVAFRLFGDLLDRLRARHGDDFRLEFTADRRNSAIHHLSRKVAACFRMNLRKLPLVLPQFEDGSEEELFEMTPLREIGVVMTSKAA